MQQPWCPDHLNRAMSVDAIDVRREATRGQMGRVQTELVPHDRSDPSSHTLPQKRSATRENHPRLAERASGPLVEPDLDRPRERIGRTPSEDPNRNAGRAARGHRECPAARLTPVAEVIRVPPEILSCEGRETGELSQVDPRLRAAGDDAGRQESLPIEGNVREGVAQKAGEPRLLRLSEAVRWPRRARSNRRQDFPVSVLPDRGGQCIGVGAPAHAVRPLMNQPALTFRRSR